MNLKILLVNPNKMQNPPVIPIGLEYLTTALEKHNHKVDILDLCFISNSIEKLESTLKAEQYDIVGFTIRNIDSCIFFNNEYFLPQFKELIRTVKKHDIPVILGGTGFSAMPYEILEYLKADYGIIGPGEIAFPKFLELWKTNQLGNRLFNGWNYGADDDLVYLRASKVNYQDYLNNEGIVGFSTHSGCKNQCPYCIEANNNVSFKKISNILEEIEYLVKFGYSHFHLCDSEFNSNLNYCIKFLERLVEKSLPMKWTLYMKPYPYNERLFKLLHESNAYLITLSVDSDNKIQTQNGYSYRDLTNIIKYSNKYQIELAIDLLTGYPYESIESTKKILEFFQKNRPKTVGISFYYRIFNNTALGKSIRNDPVLQKSLTRRFSNNDNFLEPIFFSQYEKKDLDKLISGDDLFRIAGFDSGVNYQL